MFDINQFRTDILAPTLDALMIRDTSLKELLVFTCAVESAGGTYVREIKGPALGIYQMEPATFTDLWLNFIVRQPEYVNLLAINLGVHRLPDPTKIITDLQLATACCALYYLWKKVRITSMDENDLWEAYKIYYNTLDGKAEKDASIKAYKRFVKA